jgi:hypothetical protein
VPATLLSSLRKIFKRGQAAPDLKEYLAYRPYASRGAFPHLTTETPGLATWREMRLDGQAGAALAVIKLPILSRTFAARSPNAEVEVFVQRTLARVWRNLVRATLLAVDYGFTVVEKVWEVADNGAVVYKAFKDPEPDTLELEVDAYGSYAGVRQLPGVRVPKEKAFLYTHRLEHGNLYGQSRLRPAYPFWRTKEIIYLFLNRYLERKGNPPVVVKYPPRPGTTGEAGDAYGRDALAVGKQLLENATVALPHLHDPQGQDLWEIGYLEDSPRVGMFLDYIEHLNRMILRAMFVPEKLITQEEGAGSYALAKVHADVFLMSEEGLVADLEEHFNRFIVKPLVEYNFGPDARAEIRMERFDAAGRELLRDVFMDMLAGGAVKPAAAAIARELGVPLETAGGGVPETLDQAAAIGYSGADMRPSSTSGASSHA